MFLILYKIIKMNGNKIKKKNIHTLNKIEIS